MYKTEIGLIGLGVMGKSLSLNIADQGFSISVFNRKVENEAHIVSDFINENATYSNLQGFTDIVDFVTSIQRPRKIVLMIKAGKAIDLVIAQLLPFLEEKDIIIDGGNSLYTDTIQRTKELAKKNILFVGCGISGGETGARKGPSIMLGGSTSAYHQISPILEKIAAKDQRNKPCCCHIGTDGAGHFVKMVHNGIEYAEMQLIAEIYGLLSKSYSKEEIATILTDWNRRSEASYLLEITINILRKKENDVFVIDRILDKAFSKGTGSWSSKAALDLGMPATLISSAVYARYVSSFKEQRVTLSKSITKTTVGVDLEHSLLEKAYRFARIINHQQGFEMLKRASEHFNWNLNLSEIARIWTNGCIIRSDLMQNSIGIFKNCQNYFEDEQLLEILHASENAIVNMLQNGMSNRVALNSFSVAYTYWISMTTENSSAHIIQAQRDYFGAHTYQRNDIDSSEFFHTKW